MSAANKRAAIGCKIRWQLLLSLAVFVGATATAVYFLRPHNSPNRRRSAGQADRQTHAGYGTSESCRECHAEAYDDWAGSHHARAERLPNPLTEDAAFIPSRKFRNGTQEISLLGTNGRYEVIATGLHGTNELFPVLRVLADDPLRQMLVPFPGGRLQVTEAAWDPRAKEWFDVYGAEDRKPGEWGHWTGRGMNWNSMCAACHNTRVLKNYDAATDTYQTVLAEHGVGCEACHGPMKAHNDWQHAHKNARLKDPTIRRRTREDYFNVCAGCHSRRTEITGDPVPGDDFFDHHLLAIVDGSQTFFPDGQVSDEDYEVSAFLGSRMFHAGVRCVNCHDVHTMKTRLPGNFLCLSCHGPGATNAPAINPVLHSHHKVFGFDTNGAPVNTDLAAYKSTPVKETGGECVNCHMPQTVYMQRHRRHDHGFTIPDPLLTKQFGIPNACNRCHQDKDADWSLEFVEQWFGGKMNRPTRQRAQTIARARNGDDPARDGLLKILETEPQFYWRAVAARMLERWADETEVATALAEKLSDTNALVRQSVLQTLSVLGESASPEIRLALRRTLNDSSRSVRVTAALALASELDLHSEAGRDLLHMLDHNADQPAGQMQLGGFALARGDTTNALRHFEIAETRDAFSPGIRQEIAVVFSQIGRPLDALKELQTAVELAPRDAESHFRLALVWSELGEPSKALAELEAAVKLDPRHARAQYNLGLALNAAGNPAGAIAALLAAETADPRDPRIPYARATIHAQLGEFNEARKAARRALELNPQFSEASELFRQIQPR